MGRANSIYRDRFGINFGQNTGNIRKSKEGFRNEERELVAWN